MRPERKRMIKNARTPKAATEAVIMRAFSFKSENSKKLRVNGMIKTTATMPIIVRKRVERRGLRGFEIQ